MKKLPRLALNTILLIAIIFGALILTVPVISKIPLHPDEHQFYLNAFSILKGKELHNYLHVATTEYTLAGFLLVANLLSNSGVNFPQGEPTEVTFFFGHMMGAVLYFVTFALGVIILQKREKEIKLRTVLFAILYFGSIGMFERFIRVNSDSFSIFIFFNFVILSLWQNLHKPSIIEMFLLNTLFIFLGTFTNLKSLYLLIPFVTVNTSASFLWYERAKKKDDLSLSRVYRFILYVVGICAVTIILWGVFVPKPFDSRKFWYTLKNTIIQGTEFDFSYPSLSYKSGLMYVYDLLVYQIGFNAVFASALAFFIVLLKKGKRLWTFLWSKTKGQINLDYIKEGQVYKITEILLLASFVIYYVGVSTRVVHWSRWGAPFGIIAIMLLSVLFEKLIEFAFDFSKKSKYFLPIVFFYSIFFVWGLRIALTIDLYKSDYTPVDAFKLTRKDIYKFLQEKNISLDDVKNKVTWFTGYTPEVNNMSFEQVAEKKNWDMQYLLWPHWNAGLLYTKVNVDRSTHNQRAFVDKYVDKIEFRFPTLLSYYLHQTKKFAWSVLKITWFPESDTLVESTYAALKLKNPVKSIELQYTILFKDMSHYISEYSNLFNSRTLQDTYIFPPCYSYSATRRVNDGSFIPQAPWQLGQYGKTAGLYCHSIRFRVLPKGVYAIRISGLPKDPTNSQILYYNFGDYQWDPVTQTATFGVSETFITGEFGVATKEKNLPYLKFDVMYVLNQDILEEIAKNQQKTAE